MKASCLSPKHFSVLFHGCKCKKTWGVLVACLAPFPSDFLVLLYTARQGTHWLAYLSGTHTLVSVLFLLLSSITHLLILAASCIVVTGVISNTLVIELEGISDSRRSLSMAHRCLSGICHTRSQTFLIAIIFSSAFLRLLVTGLIFCSTKLDDP